MPRIAITTSSPPGAIAHRRLTEAGVEVVDNPHGRKLTEAESKVLLRDVDGVLAGTSPLNAAVLAEASRLRVISRLGIGIDNVDVDAVEERGIALYTTPDAPALAVAELTLGMILGLLRRIAEADRHLRGGRWKPLMGQLLTGKTVGIVGMGRVGQRLTAFLEPFEVRVLAVDPVSLSDDFLQRYGVKQVALEDMLPEADIVTLHVPYSPATQHLIDEAAFARMKPSALLVNAARGGTVDEEALVHALTEGQIAGAALDTFGVEPYEGPLAAMDHVLLTCHMGSYAAESRLRMEDEAVENLLKGLQQAGLL